MNTTSTVIIGGGIAGLSVCFKLTQQGHNCQLYEASPRLGGAIATIAEQGYLLEVGPNTVLDTSDEIAAMIEILGIESEKIYANDQAKIRYVVRNGQLIPLPSSLTAFIKTPLFSTKAKLRLFAEPFIGRSKKIESVAEFVARRLGKEFLDYAINPFVAGIYAGEPQKTKC